jgi:hypothetical protein
MGLVSHGIPEEYVDILQKEFGIKCFVETGTFQGATAKWAAERFERVVTIELSQVLYQRATVTLAPYRNVKILFGDTRHHLAQIAATLPPSIVWLDAHYSGAATAGKGNECPLLGEIDALLPSWERMFVLVDDARYFLAPPPPPHDEAQWPSIVQVVNALNRGANRLIVSFEDVIVSLPSEAKRVTLQYIREGGFLNERVIGFRVEKRPERLLKRIARRLQSIGNAK